MLRVPAAGLKEKITLGPEPGAWGGGSGGAVGGGIYRTNQKKTMETAVGNRAPMSNPSGLMPSVPKALDD
jgi:hypothetical protein